MCGSCCTKSPISILPHEDVVLRVLADKHGVKYSSHPGYRVFDSISRSNIALSYVIDISNGSCPFLSRYKCVVHYEYKPLICRAFPYVPVRVSYHIVPELKIIHAKSEYRVSLLCNYVKNNEATLKRLAEKTDGALLQVVFEEQVRNALEMDSTRNTLLNLLSNLWRRKLVEIVEDAENNAPVVNLYEVLRTRFPELPYVLGINKILTIIT